MGVVRPLLGLRQVGERPPLAAAPGCAGLFLHWGCAVRLDTHSMILKTMGCKSKEGAKPARNTLYCKFAGYGSVFCAPGHARAEVRLLPRREGQGRAEGRGPEAAGAGFPGKQMYPLLFGVFGLGALGCVGFLAFEGVKVRRCR